jgi:hypothetical protein
MDRHAITFLAARRRQDAVHIRARTNENDIGYSGALSRNRAGNHAGVCAFAQGNNWARSRS